MTSSDAGSRRPSVTVGTQLVGDGGTGVRVNVVAEPDAPRSTLPNYKAAAGFVGRAAELAAIDDALSERETPQVLVLHGPPGVGKTWLAVEYASRCHASYPGGTFFVRCDQAPPPDLARLLGILGLHRFADEPIEDQCRRVLAHLGARPTLLVYDNVPDERALADWLPPGALACHVLATSTLAYWPRPWNTLPVGLLADGDARLLVGALVTDPRAAQRYADAIIAKGRGVTVELCAAARSVDYETRHGRAGAVRAGLASGTESSFGAAFRILSGDARLVLRVACLFEIGRIPADALRALFAGEGWTDERFDLALDAVHDRTLIVATADVLDVHQCVAQFVRGQRAPEIPLSLLKHHFEAFTEAARRFDEQPGQPQRSARLLAYPADLPFWTGLLAESSLLESLADMAGRALCTGGRFDEALPWCERAVEAKKKGDVHGRVDHASLGKSLHLVGDCHSSAGRFNQALPWYERAIEAAEKGDVHGRVDHVNLGSSLHQVGGCHSSAGRFDQALLWYERAVEAAEKGDVHGRVDHASLGSSLHQVGYCYSSAGRFDQALPWYERAIEAKKKGDVHGRVDHESLGKSLHQVGDCYSSAGRFDQALLWYERAVEAAEKGDVHGRVDHESLGKSLHRVGSCHSSAARFDQALPWYERAVEEKKKGDVHGRVDHGNLGRSLHRVGDCHSGAGRFDQALPWYERAAEAKKKGDVHGRVDHEILGKSLHRVGDCHSIAGRLDQALPWYERAVEEKKKGDVHGRVDHGSLGKSLRQVGHCHSSAGRFD
ncbi:tetratricopeptide repeat protein [Sorangium sp. So ce887]|uniref:tetratricopeptide repeat protein n=1 Tax=Sorangium sp. So ce887 TaxID=3133324 RepID=UPI003F5DCE9E